MDDETMQLLKALREQLGKTSASRSVDALAAANSLGLERGSLEFHRRLHDLVRAKYLEGVWQRGISAYSTTVRVGCRRPDLEARRPSCPHRATRPTSPTESGSSSNRCSPRPKSALVRLNGR